jgi:hypothetical protein
LEQGLMTSFVANMEMPEEYIKALIEVATENNMTAEQFARNIVANHLRKNYQNHLTTN